MSAHFRLSTIRMFPQHGGGKRSHCPYCATISCSTRGSARSCDPPECAYTVELEPIYEAGERSKSFCRRKVRLASAAASGSRPERARLHRAA